MSKEKSGCAQPPVGCLVIPFLLFGGCLVIEVIKVATRIEQESLEPSMPKGTWDRCQHDILAAVSIGRAQRISEEGGSIVLEFIAADNFTEYMMVGDMKTDIADAIKALQESEFEYNEITILAYMNLLDKFGEETTTKVFGEETTTKVALVDFKKSTVNNINWDNFLTDNIFDIADNQWKHPLVIRND